MHVPSGIHIFLLWGEMSKIYTGYKINVVVRKKQLNIFYVT